MLAIIYRKRFCKFEGWILRLPKWSFSQVFKVLDDSKMRLWWKTVFKSFIMVLWSKHFIPVETLWLHSTFLNQRTQKCGFKEHWMGQFDSQKQLQNVFGHFSLMNVISLRRVLQMDNFLRFKLIGVSSDNWCYHWMLLDRFCYLIFFSVCRASSQCPAPVKNISSKFKCYSHESTTSICCWREKHIIPLAKLHTSKHKHTLNSKCRHSHKSTDGFEKQFEPHSICRLSCQRTPKEFLFQPFQIH